MKTFLIYLFLFYVFTYVIPMETTPWWAWIILYEATKKLLNAPKLFGFVAAAPAPANLSNKQTVPSTK